MAYRDHIVGQILYKHLLEGELIPGTEIGIRIDQTLTQDATGTLVYLEFMSLGIDQVQASTDEFSRLLGQAATIDGTPRPWVSDIWGVLGVKYAIEALGGDELTNKFTHWIFGFLPERIQGGRLVPSGRKPICRKGGRHRAPDYPSKEPAAGSTQHPTLHISNQFINNSSCIHALIGKRAA